MSTFKIGEKVVALTSNIEAGAQPRKKGEIYTVTDIDVCKCGMVSLNLNNQISQNGYIDCECGYELKSYKYFTDSKYFRKLDYQFTENLIAELMQSEYQFN